MLTDHREDALRDLVTPSDATEDVDEDALHLLVREHDLERGLHDRFLRAPAHVEEVRGAAARDLHRVERAHDEPRPVADDPDVAVELHVAEAERPRALL